MSPVTPKQQTWSKHAPRAPKKLKCGPKKFHIIEFVNNMLDHLSTDEDEKCIICLETYKNNMKKLGGCPHTFHTECIANWFLIDSSCPVCRAEYSIPHCYFNDDD